MCRSVATPRTNGRLSNVQVALCRSAMGCYRPLVLSVLRQALCVLIAVAVVGGTTAQLARAAQHLAPVAVVGMPCDMDMPMADTAQDPATMPCKGMTTDCIKQLGCVADVAMSARLAGIEPASLSEPVGYWSAGFDRASFVSTPEPLPPRTT